MLCSQMVISLYAISDLGWFVLAVAKRNLIVEHVLWNFPDSHRLFALGIYLCVIAWCFTYIFEKLPTCMCLCFAKCHVQLTRNYACVVSFAECGHCEGVLCCLGFSGGGAWYVKSEDRGCMVLAGSINAINCLIIFSQPFLLPCHSSPLPFLLP